MALVFSINLNFGGFILKKERKEKKEKKEKRGKIINLSSPPPKSSPTYILNVVGEFLIFN